MNRLLRIGLVSLYVALTMGVHLHAHACCSDSSELSLVSFSDSCCNSGQAEGCCSGCSNDAVLDFRLEDEHLAAHPAPIKPLFASALPIWSLPHVDFEANEVSLQSVCAEAPLPKCKRYCLYCALITYG